MAVTSDRFLDLARAAAIVACVGLLYSPSVGTIGLITTYVAFVLSGQAWTRMTALLARPAVYWGLAFLGVVIMGTVYASVPWAERWTDVYKWRTILWFIVLLAIFDDPRWGARLMAVFVLGAAVGVVWSDAVAAGWLSFKREPQEVLRNAGTQGMAFACAALVCLWAVLEKQSLAGLPSWVWSVVAAACVANIVFITNARSGYALLAVGSCLLLGWRASWQRRVIIVAGVLLLGGMAFAVSERMQAKVTAGLVEWNHASTSEVETSFGSRRVFYANSWDIYRDHWLIGVGTGGFALAYRTQIAGQYPDGDWHGRPTTDPHNQYLSVAIQQGAIGLVVFCVWILAMVRAKDGQAQRHRLAVALLAGWCVTSLFSSHFRTFVEGHILTTFLGVLLAVPRPSVPLPERCLHEASSGDNA